MSHYLRVDEQATYIDVYCDGYYLNIRTNSTYPYGFYCYDLDDNKLFTEAYFHVRVNDTTNRLDKDPNITVEIIENTPKRVKIRVSGNPHDGGSYLTNSVSAKVIYTIYSDRYFKEVEWVTETGSITLNNQNLYNTFGLILEVANLTNKAYYYENAGVETVGTDSDKNDDYILTVADEINIMLLANDWTDDSIFSVYQSTSYMKYRWNDGSMPVGTHTALTTTIIDSADREFDPQF